MTRSKLPDMAKKFGIYGGMIVGSQAKAITEFGGLIEESDWDIMIPHRSWRKAARLIPKTAAPNGNGGWHFEDGGFQFDVWPDDFKRFVTEDLKFRDVSYVVEIRYCVAFVVRAVSTAPALLITEEAS